MKKILSVVLALALVCGLAVTAMAAGFGVETDKDIIEAGEEIIVTVSLDETISADQGATVLGGKLIYDESIVTLVSGSAAASEAYSFLMVNESGKGPYVTVSWFHQQTIATEFPAGVIFTATFTANSELTASVVEAAFNLELAAKSPFDVVAESEVSATVKVCTGHSWTETDRTGSCTEDGVVTYTCDFCGATKTEDAPATGHIQSEYMDWEKSYTEYDEDWMPIYQVNVYSCEYCGEEMSRETIWYLFGEDLPCTSPEVAPGETLIYQTYGISGWDMTISGSDYSVEVVVDTWMESTSEIYTPVDGNVTFVVPSGDFWSTVYVKITNTGSAAATYDLSVEIPLGDSLNPVILEAGGNLVNVPAENYNYYYTTYTAICDGEVTFTVSGGYWSFNLYCEGDPDDWSDDYYGDMHSFNDDEVVNSETISVKAGDVIYVYLSSYYIDEESWEWYYPASDITVEVSCNYTHEGHIVHVDAKEAGCYENGNIEYWYCECCEMFWQDEALTQLTNSHNVIIGAAHNLEHVAAKEANCWENGNIEYWYCTVCNDHFLDEYAHLNTNALAVVLPGGHDLVHVEGVDAGCHFKGHVEHWYCLKCDTVWTDEALTQISNHLSVIIPELGGDVIHVEAKDPTCTENGNIEHWYCECCEQVWQDEARTQLTNHMNVIIGATGHSYGEDGVCTICGDNPKSGDTTISLVVAAAVISAMSIVALPMVKKHF